MKLIFSYFYYRSHLPNLNRLRSKKHLIKFSINTIIEIGYNTNTQKMKGKIIC